MAVSWLLSVGEMNNSGLPAALDAVQASICCIPPTRSYYTMAAPLPALFVLAALGAAAGLFAFQLWPVVLARARGCRALPPGSLGWPYWGESLPYLRDSDAWFEERRAKYGCAFKTWLLGSPTVVLLGPEANKFVLCNENKLFESNWPRSLRELEGQHAVSMVVGDSHRRLRRALNIFLNSQALKAFTPRIEEIILRQLHSKDWRGDGIVHVFPALQKLAFSLNAELFMGVTAGPELEDLHRKYEEFTAGLESQPLNLPWTVFGKAKRARGVLLHYMFHKIKSRREELQNHPQLLQASNLLDLLLTSKDEDTGMVYSVDEIADNMLLLVHAGQDTTASALAVTLKHLSASPPTLDRLRSDVNTLDASHKVVGRDELKNLGLLRGVIREGLRMCPPLSGFFKRAKCDVVYNGITIPKGWTVHLSLRQTHLKDDYFPSPNTFDPSRFDKRCGNFSYLPFGQGARICPAMEFAKITMELFLFHLLRKYEWEILCPNEKMVIRTFSSYPQHGLPIKIKPIQ